MAICKGYFYLPHIASDILRYNSIKKYMPQATHTAVCTPSKDAESLFCNSSDIRECCLQSVS